MRYTNYHVLKTNFLVVLVLLMLFRLFPFETICQSEIWTFKFFF